MLMELTAGGRTVRTTDLSTPLEEAVIVTSTAVEVPEVGMSK